MAAWSARETMFPETPQKFEESRATALHRGTLPETWEMTDWREFLFGRLWARLGLNERSWPS